MKTLIDGETTVGELIAALETIEDKEAVVKVWSDDDVREMDLSCIEYGDIEGFNEVLICVSGKDDE